MQRNATEIRLDEELRRAKSFLNLEKVRALIFEFDAHASRTYITAMLTAFDSNVDDVDQSLLQIFQDAWNYFPHRFLDGRCPAEVFDELAGNDQSV